MEFKPTQHWYKFTTFRHDLLPKHLWALRPLILKEVLSWEGWVTPALRLLCFHERPGNTAHAVISFALFDESNPVSIQHETAANAKCLYSRDDQILMKLIANLVFTDYFLTSHSCQFHPIPCGFIHLLLIPFICSLWNDNWTSPTCTDQYNLWKLTYLQ